MFQIKKYLFSKEFIISFVLIAIFAIVNMIPELRYGYYFLEFKDCFAFWNTNLTIGYGQYLQIILPIIILFTSLKEIFYKLNGSYLKNVLLKTKYKKIMFKELIKSYLRAFTPLFLIVTIVFIIGYILYPDVLAEPSGSIEYLYLTGWIRSPYIYTFMTYISRFLFVSSIVNIGIIFIYFIKKIYVAILASFIFFHLFNFLIQFVIQTVSYIIGGEFLMQKLSYLSLMIGYNCGSDILISLLIMVIFFSITFLIVIGVYSNKERVVHNFEE